MDQTIGDLPALGPGTWIDLVPFPGTSEPPAAVRAALSRSRGQLRGRYQLVGDADAVDVPPPAVRPARRDGLWRRTCLEAFVGGVGQPSYLEINLSPSLDWNVYHFTGPRRGRTPLTPVEPKVSIEPPPAGAFLAVSFTLPLPPELTGTSLQANLTAVLAHPNGSVSHWAITHTSNRPDFHARDAFVLPLPAPGA